MGGSVGLVEGLFRVGWVIRSQEMGTYGGEDVPARVGEVGVLGGEREVEPRCDAADVAVEEDEAVAEERPEARKTVAPAELVTKGCVSTLRA